MKRLGKYTAALCLTVILLAGCGQVSVPETIEEPTLVLDKDGGVTAYLVGEFDKSYYDLSELLKMAREEAAEYGLNQDGAARVTVDKVEAAQDGGSRVVVSYVFDGTKSYEEYIGDSLFYGTVGEALAQGYAGVAMESIKDEGTLTGEELAQETDKHLIVTDTKAWIYCPGRVEYISSGAVMNDDGSVNASEAEGPVYILLKK